MEEDLTIPHDPAKNCSISVIEDEKEKVKDFVFKHFREVTEGSIFGNGEESSIKEHGSSARRDTQALKAHCKIQQGAVFSGKILSFGCSVCKDDPTYSPNDLLKHFRAAHKGSLPTYPCDLCAFVTNEFSALQRHRIEHRNTLVTCELCNDGIQYSLLLLTRHYIMCHSSNGQFHCDWCNFTTVDAGTFVQHIHHHKESPWKCSKCTFISLNEEDHQKHLKGHTGTFPFTCPICGYGALRNENLNKHMSAVHKEQSERKNMGKAVEDMGTTNASAGVKLTLKKSCESQDAQRVSKLNCLSGNLTNQIGRVTKPEISLEDTNSIIDGLAAKKDNRNWSKDSHTAEQSTSELSQDYDGSAVSGAVNPTSPNGLTVLMVKNKISLPPNCTTKVMGFKTVDGKKHLVLKIIPAAKQDACSQNHSLIEDGSSSPPSSVFDKNRVFDENGECSDSKTPSPYFAVSPKSDSCIHAEDDIMAVKVKLEDEETAICNIASPFLKDGVGEQNDYSVDKSSAPVTALLHPATNECNQTRQTACSERRQARVNTDALCHSGSAITNNVTVCADKVAVLSSNVSQETSGSKLLCRNVQDNCASAEETSVRDIGAEKVMREYVGDSNGAVENHSQLSCVSPESTRKVRTKIKRRRLWQNCKRLARPLTPPETSMSPSSPCRRNESSSGPENGTQSSPNQEVFAFHNYSKETFSPSPNTTPNFDSPPRDPSADRESAYEPSQFSLTLAESPEPLSDNGYDSIEENNQDVVRKVLSDAEGDGCLASVDEDENPESVLQDFNIIKIEEESIPICNKQSEKKCGLTVGNFVEEYSDAIISEQLTKERIGSGASSSNESPPKQTKTTLRILKLPDGKQPVLLRTAENRFAMPVQVKSTPGFKLITNSANPQINVSYMKPGSERSSKSSSVTSTPNTRRLGTPTAGAPEKGTLISAGLGANSNHYLINSPNLKGPFFLSNSSHNNTTDKATKAQPTCYLLQKSIPFLQTQTSPSLRLANAQLPLNSRPVLAMPVSSADKASATQSGRQAFLLRYISPPKSNLLLNNQESKTGTPGNQTGDGTGNKVIFKIVSPSGGLLTSGASTPSTQPFFLATRPQTQCFLVSSNKNSAGGPSKIQKMNSVQTSSQKITQQQNELDKPTLAPRPIRPPSQRKRRRKTLFDELPAPPHKARRLSNKAPPEKDTSALWKPVAKDVERTLSLAPLSPLQPVKCPRRHQPVVVLNHPDADIPEVANIMKVVSRYRGAVSKVSLSQKTIQALAELRAQGTSSTKGAAPAPPAPAQGGSPRSRPVASSVRERFLLKLKLRKKSKKKYEVVDKLSDCGQPAVAFDCWFCGRLFSSQEDWIGHGQRHLMEATRDWNKLF